MKQTNEHLVTKLFYAWLFVALTIFTFIIPPFQKPDEIVHFYRATALVKGELFCKDNDKGKGYFVIPRNFFELPNQMFADTIAHQYNQKFPITAITLKHNTNTDDTKISDICILPFTGYLSNAVGIGVGLLFNNPVLAFYLGRLTAMIIFLTCILISLKYIPKKYRAIIYFYAFIPMVLHQATAISYDALQLSLIIVIVSLLLKFLSAKQVTIKQLVTFTVLLAVLSLAKTGYYPILLLYFLVPYSKVTNRLLKYVLLTIATFGSAVIVNGIFAKMAASSLSGTGLINPQLQLKYLSLNPLALPQVIFNSFQAYGDVYYRTFIGIFGWLDYGMNPFVYQAFVAIAAFVVYVLIRSNNKPLINKKQLLLILAIIASVIGFVFLSEYLGYTYVASRVVAGVQGRYLLVLLPIALFALVQFALLIGKRRFYILLGVGFAASLMAYILFNAIYNRYYNYTNFYIYENEQILPNTVLKLSLPTTNSNVISIKQDYKFMIDNVSVDKKIGGFNMIFKTNQGIMATPYQYYIKDAQCSKTLEHGFLDMVRLQYTLSPTLYEDGFPSVIKQGNSKLCILLSPFTDTKSAGYINLVTMDNKILFQPLYIR
jgi:uncharacterized membrane protein